jgi:predicted amidohydrolase YtcJ
MRSLFLPILLLAMVPVEAIGAAPEPPESIFVANRIWTMNSEMPVAEAVAVKNGVIQAIGQEVDILKLAGPSTTVHRLDEATILPGLIDSHCHLLSLGLSLDRLDLVGTTGYAEVLEMVRERAAAIPKGEWILGRGWDQNDWEDKSWPTMGQLDEVSPDHPVYLKRVDGHAAVVNSAAFKLAGIDRRTPDPDGGKILKENGRPIGVLIDNAMELIDDVIPSPTKEAKRQAILRAADLCMSAGLVGVHEAGVSKETLELYREMADAGELPFSVYAMISKDDEDLQEMMDGGPEVRRGGVLTVRSIKVYADGALGSRGAALLEPYSDDPGNMGLLMVDEDSLAAFTADALRRGFQVCTHAKGDRANRVVLNAYEKAMETTGIRGADARLRIEHAQLLEASDLRRFGTLKVIAAMQPTHCTSDMPWAPKRLGSRRLPGAYAWASLRQTGAVICGGSDFPVESHEPLLGFYAAITREDTTGHPVNGYNPSEKMHKRDALLAFTYSSAYAAFEEDVTGSLKPGKRADMTILDMDIIAARDPHDILDAEVVMTVVGGRVVFQREEID